MTTAAGNESLISNGRIVIVGASLAGLRAAETLRREGFRGRLTMIGDEPYEPYDRPPFSKQVLVGLASPERTALPRMQEIDADWRLGSAATRMDLRNKRIELANGEQVEFDRVLIATGVRARPWPNKQEADLDGVFTLRTRDDATRLMQRLEAKPKRVLVIGAGFTGSEMASGCRERGLDVTVVERGTAPLVGALGGVIGAIAAEIQRSHGVDLRTGITVTSLEGDATSHLRAAKLSDGSEVEAEIALVGLGAIRNTEWLAGSGLAAGYWGIACDTGCRAADVNGIVTDDVFVAGDVANFPLPLYDYQFLALEHWGNAVAQGETAAHNMISGQTQRRPHLWLPAFWSSQFGISIKSVGVPSFSDSIVITQGSTEEHRFVAAYGYKGRMTAAVAFDGARWLPFYESQIEQAAHFPPDFQGVAQSPGLAPVPSDFPPPGAPSHSPTVVLTGHNPNERHAEFVS
jgi:3-phenylpropionate/trans-cinnamate dioxygenase ferredoxin reductase component